MRNPIIDKKGGLKPVGEQPFVNWQYVDAGAVAWRMNGKKAPQWGEPVDAVSGEPTGAFGIRLEAQKAKLVGPLFELDKPWEANYNMYFTYALYEDGLYKAWYSCIPPDHAQQTDVRYKMASGQVLCYAESEDGVHWRKPALGLEQYAGEETNICFGRGLSPYGFQSGSIYKDPNGGREDTFKMIYVGLKPVEDLAAAKEKYKAIFGDAFDPKGFTMLEDKPYVKGLFAAVSPDAIHWTCVEEPIMIQPSDTLNTVIWDDQKKTYVAYIRLRHGDRRLIGRVESKDFYCWKQAPEVAVKAPLDWSPCDDIYTNNRMNYPNSNVRLMFPNVYHRFIDSRNVYLASSLDDVIWEFVPGGPVVTNEGCGQWCSGDLNPGLGFVPYPDDCLAMPMLGYSRPHKFCRGGLQKLGQPGFAVWKKGRICAIVADERGAFATPAISFAGNKLVLNFETAVAGSILVEVRGAKGEKLEGFSFEDCDFLSGNEIEKCVSWKGNADLSTLNGQDICIAFRLLSAKLYSFEIK